LFNIGMMELVLVLLVAFLVVGPKDLPKVARWIARQVKSLRKLVREVKKETGWDEFAKEFRETGDELRQTMKDADVSEELKGAANDIETEINAAARDVQAEGEKLRKEFEGGNQS